MRKHAFAFALALALALAAVSLSAQTPYLVKDINTTTAESPLSSSPENFFPLGSRIFFSAGTSDEGFELFSTDGTSAGTALVADLYRGSASSSPSRFVNLDGTLIFNARDSHGEELWMSDGTAGGTRLMADIAPGSGSSSPGDRIVFDGKMLFAAGESVYGYELWITDGTPAGTRFFKDLAAGTVSSSPRAFVLLGGTIYFGTNDALWKSDGTEAGTVVVKEHVTPSDLVVAGSRIFFHGYDTEAGTEPWVTDGTSAGTHRIKDIAPGTNSSVSYSGSVAFGDRLLFVATEPEHGMELWITDGTEAGTSMLADFRPGSGDGLSFDFPVAILGNRAIFPARRAENGSDLWITDGTSAGTYILREFANEQVSVGYPVTAGDRVYFAAGDANTARIWITDGTLEGTRPVTNPDSLLSIRRPFTNIRGTLYFSGANRLNGFELWKSDGTAAGTMMLKNLNKDGAPSSDPDRFFVADDYLYFAAWNGFATRDYRPLFTFWRTDGTSGGTVEVGDQIAGDFGDFAAGRRLLFTGNNPFGLWTTDGSPASEQPATEFENRFPGTPSVRYVSGDKIFVLSGEDLYVTTIDYGAPAVSLGASDVTFGFGELAGRVLFFTESAGTYDHALWITDGTPAGTHVVRSFEERSGGSLVAMSGHAYFVVSDDVNNGFMLWRTDGTAEGTVAVTEVPGFYKPVVTGGRMFFRTNDGGKLWVTDGTAAGTRELPVAVGGSIAPIGNSVVFIAADTTSGTEPWVSDGTPEGTHLLADIYPGAGGSAAGSMTAAGTVAYFYAYSKNEGDELWMTDGTTAGTRLAGDIEPGPLSSYPFNLIRAGERVYFTPRQTTTGKELWAVDLPPTPRLTIADVRTNENGVAHFTARLHKASPQTVTVEYATSDGTASATSDYDSATGTLTFAAGETAKSFDVHIRADAAMEENETFLVTLRNAAGAAIETSVAAAIIEDDDRSADLALAADFSNWGGITLDMTNHGPGVATNIRGTMTAVPVTYEPAACWYCPFVQLAPNETERALSYAETEHQQYLTATVTALEDDPQPSNNTLAWTTNGLLTMNALHLTPGASATIWHRNYQPIPAFSVESSDPSVVSVPASVSGATSFAVQGLKAGRATVRAFTAQQTIGTIAVDVIAPGTKVRYADAILFFPDYYQVLFDDRAVIHSFSMGSAPFTGARPTGIVTVTAGVFELTRMQLAGDGKRIALRFLLPSVGTHTVTVTYEGDENFLPVTETFEMQSLKGSVNVNATATRQGENVILRVRISGSPAAAPTGTIRAGMQEELIALTPIGPGLSAAEVTIPHGDATTIDVTYYGDTNYTGAVQSVPVMDARRRSTRH